MRWSGWSLVILLLTNAGTRAHAQGGAEGRLPVKVIGGRLTVRCELSTPRRRIPATLLLVLDRPCGLELHNRAADHLEAEKGAGFPITLHFPGLDVAVPRRELGDEDLFEEITKLHSTALADVACIGALGTGVLRDFRLVLDVRNGLATLDKPKSTPSGGPPPPVAGSVTSGLTLVNDQLWVPVTGPKGRSWMNISSSRIDTLVDESLCRDHPDGNVGTVSLGGIDVSRYVALRPEILAQVHPDGAFGTLGLGFLNHFRIEIDRVDRFVRLTETSPAEFPAADRAFFAARAREGSVGIFEFLDQHAKSRLAREASDLLVERLLDEEATPEIFARALQWKNETRIADLRATEALGTMRDLLAARRADLAIVAGRLAIPFGRADRYPESIHQLHARLGRILLDSGRDQDAWEHLLSAAFGLPEDGLVHLDLGRFYENAGRYERAMSRYVQAVVLPESGALAVPALERLQRKTTGEPLSVDTIDRLIAGKVENFGAPTVFAPDASNATNRVVLVELFTNAHLGRKMGEQWISIGIGGAMGLEGLLSHYPRTHMVAINYHLPEPEPSALVNATGLYQADCFDSATPNITVIDGRERGPGASRSRDAEAVYEQNRALVASELLRRSDHEIAGAARLESGRIVGSVTVKGPAAPGARVQLILVERGVMYPGKSQVVVHRMVARTHLTPTARGVPFELTGGACSVPFDMAVDEIPTRNEKFLADLEEQLGRSATRLGLRPDPRQLTVVAVLRGADERDVLQAFSTDVLSDAETGPR